MNLKCTEEMEEGGLTMSTNLKRFTISVTPVMEEKLDELKQQHYYKKSQTSMIRDLINRGLNTLESESQKEGKNIEKASYRSTR